MEGVRPRAREPTPGTFFTGWGALLRICSGTVATNRGERMEDDDRARRWALVLPHRDRLLRLARGLVGDPGDAEACVQEALTRCVTFPALDEGNVAGFLVVTTRRLCVDHHRAHAHATRVAARLSAYGAHETAVDEAVCDR